jgi:hypothetical protein
VPNSHPDDSPVSWGRFEVSMRALDERLDALFDQNKGQALLLDRYGDELAAAEENRRSLASTIDHMSSRAEERKQRTWTLVTLLLTGLALPLILSALAILFHLKGR